jgi:acetyl-CoA acetyltransferase family protein
MVTSVRNSLRSVYLVDGLRTPIGRHGGALSRVRPDDLAAHVVEALLARNPASVAHVDQVVLGAANQAGEDGGNVARLVCLLCGLPFEVPAVTVNRLCGSGLEAIAAAARMIMVGEADCAVAGGVESTSRAPFVMSKPTQAFSRQAPEIYETSLGRPFPNPRLGERCELTSAGETAENVAQKHGIGRTDQDAFALESHRRAAAATEAGRLAAEIVPVTVPQPDRAAHTVTRDESIRAEATVAELAALGPAFRTGGTVTVGNSSPPGDGAAAVLLASGQVVEQCALEPAARLLANITVGVDPSHGGEGPIGAVRALLKRAGLRVPNIDLFELDETFAAHALACGRALGLDASRVNVNGGAIAIGHPSGCSGARMVVTLLHALRRRDGKLAIATLSTGMGQGLATLIERV